MKRFFVVFALLFAMTGMASADPLLGSWKTQVDDDSEMGNYALIKFSKCGDKFCGKIARTFDKNGEIKSENIGKNLVWDMVAKGNGSYKKGKIWQPSTDKVYSSKLFLEGDVLKVSGCIGPFCKKQTWTRAK